MRSVPFGLIVLACLLMLGRPLLFPDLVLLPADLVKHALPFADAANPEVRNRLIADVMEQFYPYYAFVREEFRNGRLPLWNPYVLNGTPFFATAVSAVFSPLNLILLPVPLETSYEWAALLKLLLAGAGVFLFLRRIGLSPWGAAAGAAAFQFSGYQIFFLLYPNTAVSMCLGWGFWSVEGLLASVTRRRVAILAVIVCVCILGGQPECSLLALMAWTLYALVRNWRRLGSVVVGSVLGVMMSAVVLLPFVELVVGGGTLELRSWPGRNPWSMQLWALPALLSPYFLGCPINEPQSVNTFRGLIYVGTVPLVLALGSFFSRIHRRVVRSLWVVAAGAFVILFGIFPFFDLFTALPLLRNANHLHVALVLQAAVAALAGIGVEVFSGKDAGPGARRLVFGAAFVAGLAALVLFVRPGWNPDALAGSYCFGPWRFPYPFYPLLGLGCLIVLYALEPRRFSAGALCLILITGVFFGVDFNPAVSRKTLDRSNAIVQQLGPHGHHRIAATGVATLLPNYGMSLGLRDARGYESLVTGRVPALYRLLSEQEPDPHHFIPSLDLQRLQLLRTMGVTRILTPVRYELEGLTPVRSEFPFIYGVEGAGRVDLVGDVTIVEDGASALSHILNRPFGGEAVVEASPQDHLFLSGIGGAALQKPHLAERGSAEWIRDWPDLVELRTKTSAPVLLVLRDTYYRGWRASVDSVEVPIWRTDYLFRGVEVPAGEHTVRFEFRPLSFRIGLAISILAWLAGMGLFVAKWIK